ncbi:8863_t:CDS:2, partial [Acaulospora morrowiae]
MSLLSWLTSLSVLAFYFICVEGSFTPSARAGHSAVLYELNVYFQGGAGSSPSVSSDFFYLNLSTPFDTTNQSSIPWTNLSLPLQPSRSFAFSCVSGKSIFIFGDLGNTPPPVIRFDLTDLSWKTPVISGLTTQNSSSVANQCLTTGDGKIYMFTGNIVAFDTTSLAWLERPSKVTTVRNKNNVILQNGTVIFVGGEMGDTSSYLLYQKIWSYDTKSDVWTGIDTKNNVTSGCTPTASVLVSDGRIVIFGCFQGDITSGIVVVDTKNNYEFFKPNISNQGPPPNLVDFTATSIGSYILIAFGRNSATSEFSSNIYLLDIRQRSNFTWTTSYDPKNEKPSDPVDSSDGSTKVNGGLIAGVIIGIAVLIGIVSFLLYKRSKYMDSVRWGHLRKFGFGRSRNDQQDTFVIPYQENPVSTYQDTYAYDPNKLAPRDGGASSSMSGSTVQDVSKSYNLNVYDPYATGASGHLSRSSSVYSRQTDFDEENG